ncbi:MAG: TerB family tellurite resistance protein [Bacteriovoracaceae bacterium]|nr:TerB family tellurite resistance protein [Bacteriovoracaceae bacterium]
MKVMDESKFHMWRGTICAANLDNKITSEEKSWLQEHLLKLPFDAEQLKIIQKDLNSPPSIEEVLPLITAPADRSMLLHFANIIFHADGDFSSEEKDFRDVFTKKIMSGIQVEKILDESEIHGVLKSESSNIEGGFGLLTKWFSS